jgi:hypothetical protein
MAPRATGRCAGMVDASFNRLAQLPQLCAAPTRSVDGPAERIPFELKRLTALTPREAYR